MVYQDTNIFEGANSVYAQTILDLAKRKPHLLFGEGADPYDIETWYFWLLRSNLYVY